MVVGVAALAIIMMMPADASVSIGDIPPTRAFQKIFSGLLNVTANKYNANLNLTGYGITITPIYANNTIQFSVDGTALGPMESLSNVTSTGCAVGQARTVNASGWYVCSNVGTGDVTGAANVGTGTGTIFRDETSGTLNLKTILAGGNVTITNNANEIVISATASSGGGFTKITNVGATRDISPVATNSSGVANIRGIDCGQGLTCTNGTGINANTMATSFKVDDLTATNKIWPVGFSNSSGDWSTRTFGVNTLSQTCSASQFVSAVSINNSTGATSATCSSVSGLPVTLSGNLTTTSSAAFTTIFTIPLTANSGNVVQGTLIADTQTAGVAVQTGARLSAMTQTGWCLWETPTTATANTVDFLVLSTTTAETGETAWLPAVNTPQPIRFTCATKGGGTPNLLIEFQAETGVNTVNIRGGSFYLKTP